MQDVDDFNKVFHDTIENQVIPMHTTPNPVVLITRNQRKGEGHIGKRGATVKEFINEGYRSCGIMRADILADVHQVSLGLVRDDNPHDSKCLRNSSRTAPISCVCPASASATPRAIAESSAANRCSRSIQSRNASRITSLLEL